IQAAQGLGVPAWSDRKHRMDGGSGLGEPLRGEQHERAELMQHRIVRHDSNRRVRELERLFVIPLIERLTRLVELVDRFLRNARRQSGFLRGAVVQGHGHHRLGITEALAFLVVRVVIIPVAERRSERIGAPPGQSDRCCDRVVIPHVVPVAPVSPRMAPIPASIPWVVIVEPILPVLTSLVSIILPVLANLVAPALPVLAPLAPVPIGPVFPGQSISRQSILESLPPILEWTVCWTLAGATVAQSG